MKKRFVVGIMGCASIAERMMIPAIQNSLYFDLKLIASRSQSKAKQFAQKFNIEAVVGYENLLNNPNIEVIYMPLPTGLHLEWAIKTLNAGKHLLIEKSLANNYEETKTIVSLAKKKGLLVMENFMFQYHSQMGELSKLLDSHVIGDIRSVHISFGFPPFKDSSNIRYSHELGGGSLLDAGSYTLKIAQLLPVGKLKIQGASLVQSRTHGVDISGECFLTTNQGIGIHISFGFQHHYQCKLEIWGSQGKIIAHRIFTAGPNVIPKIEVETEKKTIQISTSADNHFINLLSHFGNCLQQMDFIESEYQLLLQQSYLLEELRLKAEIFYQN